MVVGLLVVYMVEMVVMGVKGLGEENDGGEVVEGRGDGIRERGWLMK